jgi:hypothetical protein
MLRGVDIEMEIETNGKEGFGRRNKWKRGVWQKRRGRAGRDLGAIRFEKWGEKIWEI